MKGRKLAKCAWICVWILGILAIISGYLIVSPYSGWTSYTIDNFVSFSYPSSWHVQYENFMGLSGVETLFLISNYSGKLSTQSLSSPDEEYLIEAYKTPRTKIGSIDEYVKPLLKNV